MRTELYDGEHMLVLCVRASALLDLRLRVTAALDYGTLPPVSGEVLLELLRTGRYKTADCVTRLIDEWHVGIMQRCSPLPRECMSLLRQYKKQHQQDLAILMVPYEGDISMPVEFTVWPRGLSISPERTVTIDVAVNGEPV